MVHKRGVGIAQR